MHLKRWYPQLFGKREPWPVGESLRERERGAEVNFPKGGAVSLTDPDAIDSFHPVCWDSMRVMEKRSESRRSEGHPSGLVAGEVMDAEF